MDKVVDKLAGMGVAGLVLAVTMASSGYAGFVAVTTALGILGGPFGMVAGIGVLLLASAVSSYIAKYGIDVLAVKIVSGLQKKGKSKEQIIYEIEKTPSFLISKDLKLKLKDYVNKN